MAENPRKEQIILENLDLPIALSPLRGVDFTHSLTVLIALASFEQKSGYQGFQQSLVANI